MYFTERLTTNNNWITILVLLLLIAIAYLRHKFKSRFELFLEIPFRSNKYLLLYGKNNHYKLEIFDFTLSVIKAISYSIFTFITWKSLIYESLEYDRLLFGKICVGVFFYFTFRYFIEKMITTVFGIENSSNAVQYSRVTYTNYFGIILIPINIMLLYLFPQNKNIIITSIIISVFFSLIVLFQTIRNHQKLIVNQLFYFILYLCSLEIAPIILIIGLVNS